MAVLATVADLATYLQRDLSAEDTATAELVLESASATIRNYTRQTLSRATTTDTLRGSANWDLVLPERPVISVASVSVDGTVLLPADYTLSGDTLTWTGGWPLVVTVTYTHGFDPIPEDIREVCLAVAGRAMQNPSQMDSETIGNYSYKLRTLDNGSMFLGGEKEQLNRYRRRVLAASVA